MTFAGLNDEAAFGTVEKKESLPKAPAQDFVKANPRDPNYQTLVR